MNPLDDIITAVITPIGEGGISVIRISGKGAIEIIDNRFQGKHPLISVASHTAHFGIVVDRTGDVIDEVIATVYRSPHSYTAEDSVEVSCHGGMYVAREILRAIIESGARLAEPGEFTKRAFLNGRIDLSQAEAVADIIRSRSETSHRVSVQQLQGNLSNKIKGIRNKLLSLCGMIELELDFSEEGLEFTDKKQIANEIETIGNYIDQLVSSYQYGKLCREGVRVAITGRPNVGKSSIFNSLLNQNRAIVTDIPGTTRDIIEENLIIDGLLFTLNDTAGLRESDDIVEKEGVSRTEKAVEESDIIVFVIEANNGFCETDEYYLRRLLQINSSRTGYIIVANKIDLCKDIQMDFAVDYSEFQKVCTSAISGHGLAKLKEEMVRNATRLETLIQDKSVLITNARHRQSLVNARENLNNALSDLKSQKSNEFIALYLRLVLDNLGEIIGVVTTDEILNSVFSNFCIGK